MFRTVSVEPNMTSPQQKFMFDIDQGRNYNGLGHGLVAQLGERRVRNAEVESSILFESTMI